MTDGPNDMDDPEAVFRRDEDGTLVPVVRRDLTVPESDDPERHHTACGRVLDGDGNLIEEDG